MEDTLENEGNILRRLVMTTIKSSQFHASLRYVPFPPIKPIAIIYFIEIGFKLTFTEHSNVKRVIKIGSLLSTIWFLQVVLPSSV